LNETSGFLFFFVEEVKNIFSQPNLRVSVVDTQCITAQTKKNG